MERQEQIALIQAEYLDIKEVLNEKSLRWWCASKARAYNRVYKKGGVSIIREATGVSRSRIQRGIKEMESATTETTNRLRKEGGERKKNNRDTTPNTK